MAERVVDGLEPIQVDVADSDAGMRIFECLGEAVEELSAVRKPGQWVVQRLVAHPFLELVAFGHVLEKRQRVGGCAVGATDQ